jgi:hypothetical protein
LKVTGANPREGEILTIKREGGVPRGRDPPIRILVAIAYPDPKKKSSKKFRKNERKNLRKFNRMI